VDARRHRLTELVAPPLIDNDPAKLVRDAPIRAWQVIASFDTAADCENQRLKINIIIQVDTLSYKIPNFVKKAAAAGCRKVFIGLENINPDSLKGASKGQNHISEYRILTYFGNSTSNKVFSLGIPLIGGLTISAGGYCHVIFRVKEGRVAELRYSGETEATLAPDAYCAPIVRGCVDPKTPDAPRSKAISVRARQRVLYVTNVDT
jgi:hypothetical protein